MAFCRVSAHFHAPVQREACSAVYGGLDVERERNVLDLRVRPVLELLMSSASIGSPLIHFPRSLRGLLFLSGLRWVYYCTYWLFSVHGLSTTTQLVHANSHRGGRRSDRSSSSLSLAQEIQSMR